MINFLDKNKWMPENRQDESEKESGFDDGKERVTNITQLENSH